MNSEAGLRLTFFCTTFTVFALCEFFWPHRAAVLGRLKRWPTNLMLSFGNSLLMRVLFPIMAVECAMLVQQNGWGLLHQVDLSFIAEAIISIIVFDLIIYWQHRLFHKWDLLWRLHQVHHTDPDLDVSSGARFHPIEIALSMLIKMTFVLIIGPPVVAVVAFEIILSSLAVFNHGNFRIPKKLDRWLRYLIVTPDMHRIHHSWRAEETNSNYGFNLSIWDRWFHSYKECTKEDPHQFKLGTPSRLAPNETQNLPRLLTLPFFDLKNTSP